MCVLVLKSGVRPEHLHFFEKSWVLLMVLGPHLMTNKISRKLGLGSVGSWDWGHRNQYTGPFSLLAEVAPGFSLIPSLIRWLISLGSWDWGHRN